MHPAAAAILAHTDHCDRNFEVMVVAYAMAKGTVSNSALTAELSTHSVGGGNYCYFTRIKGYRSLAPTGNRVGGTLEYTVSPTLETDNPTLYRNAKILATEFFS